MVYIKQVLLVGLGGAIGSSLRFIIGGWVQGLAPMSSFPYGTLAVNVIGCLLIGLLGGLAEYRGVLDPMQRAFLIIGVLGGFTTDEDPARSLENQIGWDGHIFYHKEGFADRESTLDLLRRRPHLGRACRRPRWEWPGRDPDCL